jgi:hypothetical protein
VSEEWKGEGEGHVHISQDPVIQPFIGGVACSLCAHIGIGGHQDGPDQNHQHDLRSIEFDRSPSPRVQRPDPRLVSYSHLIQDTEPEDEHHRHEGGGEEDVQDGDRVWLRGVELWEGEENRDREGRLSDGEGRKRGRTCAAKKGSLKNNNPIKSAVIHLCSKDQRRCGIVRRRTMNPSCGRNITTSEVRRKKHFHPNSNFEYCSQGEGEEDRGVKREREEHQTSELIVWRSIRTVKVLPINFPVESWKRMFTKSRRGGRRGE